MNGKTTITEEIKTLKKALAYVKIAFGKPFCKEFNPDCAACKGNQLIGYLEWYLDTLDAKNNGRIET